mgnify:CR=1 FL=1
MYEDVLCRNISINKNNIRFIELYKVKVNEGTDDETLKNTLKKEIESKLENV